GGAAAANRTWPHSGAGRPLGEHQLLPQFRTRLADQPRSEPPAHVAGLAEVGGHVDALEPAICAVVARDERIPAVHDPMVVQNEQIARIQDALTPVGEEAVAD